MKVSVVIPVYNAGAYLDRSIGSMLAQTLPPGELEVVAVDDGSTDDSPGRLDAIAADHPRVRVIHTPNSGWPGRPRNIGIEAATGEYVQFLDQDDWMPSGALERLYQMGRQNDADIVLGKVASNFRPVSQGVFRHTMVACTVWDAPLIDSLTPHKMFRSVFLRDNGIRFPEGRRRLEDQLFMTKAYFAARNVSIIADQAYYFYAHRADDLNAGSEAIIPEGYYANLREVLEVVIGSTEPGADRHRFLRRFWRAEMLGRLSEPSYPDFQPAYQGAMFRAVRELAGDLIPPEVDDELGPVLRARASLVRGNRPDALRDLARSMRAVKLEAAAGSWRWSTGRLVVNMQLRFAHGDGRPLTLVRRGDELLLDPDLTTGIIEPIVVTEPLPWRAEVSVRHPETGEEWTLPQRDVRVETMPAPNDPEALVPQLVTSATLDPGKIAGGHPLARGAWRLTARLVGPGFDRRAPVAGSGSLLSRLPAPTLVGSPPHALVPYRNDDGTLGIDVDRVTTTLAASAGQRRIVPLPQEGSRILVQLPIIMRRHTPTVRVEVLLTAGGRERSLRAVVAPRDIGVQRAVLAFKPSGERLPAGRYAAAARLDGEDGPAIPIGTVAVDARGRLALDGARRMGPLRRTGRLMRRVARDWTLWLARKLPPEARLRLRTAYGMLRGQGRTRRPS